MNHKRTVTMSWDGLGEGVDDEDCFFETRERVSSAVPLDLEAASDDDEDEFEDSRMSFASSASFKRIYSIEPITQSSSVMPSFDMWMAEPGDVKERRKRLLQGFGLASNRDLLKLASSKISRAVSRKPEPAQTLSEISEESKKDEPSSSSSASPSPSTAIVLVRSRSDGDIDAFSAKTKQRKEELLGPISKQRLTRTSSGQLVPSTGLCQYLNAVRNTNKSPTAEKNRSQAPNNDVSLPPDAAFGSFFLIKNLDTGSEFIVKEANEQGMWNMLNDVQTGKQLTMEEFEKSVGYSPVVKELMRRASKKHNDNAEKVDYNSYFAKSFRNSRRKGAAILKNIKGVATSVSGLLVDKEQEQSSIPVVDQKVTTRSFSVAAVDHKISKNASSVATVDQKAAKSTSPWVEARQQGKSYKEFTALHLSQEIQAHEGSIWTIRFNSDGQFLASAGEDRVIHVWEVQDCDVISQDIPMPSELKKKGAKKGDSIPEFVNMPETVFSLSEKPICTFEGHKDDVLDLSWSKSQLLLSSSMDKTVRMWDMETKSCLKVFPHNDYVTCIQFNPVNDDYFISGSLDAKIRIWSTTQRKVVDWVELREMVTAACYTPDGQGAIVGSHEGCCRMYTIEDSKLEHTNDLPTKKKCQAKMFPGFQAPAKKTPGVQPQTGKITGFQFAPWNPFEVLITSTDSRIEIYNGAELTQKFKGYRNTGSQISAYFTPDGKHIISASEDSHVYIWQVDEPKNLGNNKKRTKVTIQAYEQFPCNDVSAAIPWPGSARHEPPVVDIQSKRHSKRSSLSPSIREDNNNLVGESSRRVGDSCRRSPHLPPMIPKKAKEKEKEKELERNLSSIDEDNVGESGRIDPGIGVDDSFGSSSASMSFSESADPSSIANGSSAGGVTIQATAWGLVIVTASLGGEIRVYQNFGLPVKVARQAYLF